MLWLDVCLLLLRNTDDSPATSDVVEDFLAENRRCHPGKIVSATRAC